MTLLRTGLFSRKTPGGAFTIADIERNPGDVYFVNSATGTDAVGNGTNPDQPFATVAFAVGQVTSGQGDVIFVAPGHTENIAAAAGINCTKTLFSIIGLGNGLKRPTFSWTTATTATWAIAGANITIRNIRCTSTFAGMVKLFVITAAGCTLDTIDYLEDGTHDALQFANLSSAATDCTIQNCSWIQSTTAASALSQWVVYVAAHRLRIINCYVVINGFPTSNPANGAVVGSTTLSTNIRIASNTFLIINSTGNIAVSCFTGDTGFIEDNYVASSKTAIAGTIACASCFACQNFASHTANKDGFLEPAVDT